MPGTVAQELSRILKKMQEDGIETVWLSPDNRKVLQDALTKPAAFRPVSATTPPRQTTQQLPPQPAQQTQQAPLPQQTFHATPPPVEKTLPSGWSDTIAGLDWNALDEQCRGCNACSLAPQCRQRLFHAGQTRARVAFVGECATPDDEAAGRLLSGPAGIMLSKMATAMGLFWSDSAPATAVALVNVLKCRPNGFPTDAQVAACTPYLFRQIELLRPDVLVLLGALPVKVLTGKTGFSQLRGKWLSYRGIPAMPIQSPAQIMRFARQPALFNNERRLAWTSLQEVMAFLQKNSG